MTMIVYRDTAGEWRWRIVAANGRVVADSGEGYKRRGACLRMAERIAGGCDVLEVREA